MSLDCSMPLVIESTVVQRGSTIWQVISGGQHHRLAWVFGSFHHGLVSEECPGLWSGFHRVASTKHSASWLLQMRSYRCAAMFSAVVLWPCPNARYGRLLATRPFRQHAVAGHQSACIEHHCRWTNEVFLSTGRYWLKREPNLIETASTPCIIELLWHLGILLNSLVQTNIAKTLKEDLWYCKWSHQKQLL